MKSLNELRAIDAKAKADFYTGVSDRHPHGLSGMGVVLPSELSKNMWDVAPRAAEFSEYGNGGGWDYDPWLSRKESRIQSTRLGLRDVVRGLERLRAAMARRKIAGRAA